VPLALIVIALVRHRPYPMMMAWTGVILLVCLAPVAIWLTDKIRAGRAVPGHAIPTTTGIVR
jgi:TRAP-type uncharacterized transport system fused permease subunit